MRVINFFGGPGSGKTTAAAGLFHELKKRWAAVEMASEYAKDLILNGESRQLSQQIMVFANQEMRLDRLRADYDWAITDAPLLLSAFYAPRAYPPSYRRLVLDMFESYDNVNIFVRRSHAYKPEGRIQREERHADRLAEQIEAFLAGLGFPYISMSASDASPACLTAWLQDQGWLPPAPPTRPQPPIMAVHQGHGDATRRAVTLRDLFPDLAVPVTG